MKSNGSRQGVALCPEVTEEDIREIEQRWGVIFDPPRREILRSNSSFDVQACPGSGKTTLLVAKLALLAKRWPHTRRGICVLSHTNVARREIEEKLSGTGVGERLLNYPHFVGTIHGFVNDYLALPLLRSEGHRVRFIDDDACGSFCNKLLHTGDEFERLRSFLRIKDRNSPDKTIRNLVYVGKDLNLGAATGKLPCGPSAPSFADLLKIKSAAAGAGLWRFEDMFSFAERLLEKEPMVVEFARWRFPVCFIDEMQDTSELQIRVLAKLFPASACVLRQRFGDSNQAIFDRGQTRAMTDVFPGSEVRGIANSQRFDQAIAFMARPLAPDQKDVRLIGEGPPRSLFPEMCGNGSMPHTIFLFSSDSAQRVLPAFAELLLKVFPGDTLRSERFLARAIGRVGRPAGEEDEQGGKLPRGLRDYWPKYEAEGAKREPRPERLAEFIHLAQRQRVATGDCALAVDTVVRGIFQLIERVVTDTDSWSGKSMRRIRELLAVDRSALNTFTNLLWKWCIEVVPLSESTWLPQLRELRTALTPVIGDRRTAEAKAFCEWSTVFAEDAASKLTSHCDAANLFRFPEEDPKLAIDVGTIHGAKGQTHTATLVLETYSWGHDLGNILEWLAGERHGADRKTKTRQLERLRLIYTAMTRPTHLLCLAMREKALDGKGGNATIDALRNRGWQVKLLD